MKRPPTIQPPISSVLIQELIPRWKGLVVFCHSLHMFLHSFLFNYSTNEEQKRKHTNSKYFEKVTVVIIYCDIFLLLLLTLLSLQSCPASHAQPCDCPPLHHSLVTICQYVYPRHSSPQLLFVCLAALIIPRLSCISRSRVLYKPCTFMIITTLRRCSTVKITALSLSFLSGI